MSWNWILSIITGIISGIISGLIANWLYEKHLRQFLNEIEDKIKNLPDELHRKALLKDFNEGNSPKIIDNKPLSYSNKEFDEMRNGKYPGKLSKDLRNKLTTGNPKNESRIWKIRNWLKNVFKN